MKNDTCKWSIRWKIIFLAGFCLFVALSSLVGYSIYNASNTQALVHEQTSLHLRKSAEEYVSVLASEKAGMITKVLDKNYHRVNALATSVLFMHEDAKVNGKSDEQLRTSINQFIKKNAEK